MRDVWVQPFSQSDAVLVAIQPPVRTLSPAGRSSRQWLLLLVDVEDHEAIGRFDNAPSNATSGPVAGSERPPGAGSGDRWDPGSRSGNSTSPLPHSGAPVRPGA